MVHTNFSVTVPEFHISTAFHGSRSGPRVGSGGVQNLTGRDGSSWVGSGGYQTSRAGSTSNYRTRKKPCLFLPRFLLLRVSWGRSLLRERVSRGCVRLSPYRSDMCYFCRACLCAPVRSVCTCIVHLHDVHAALATAVHPPQPQQHLAAATKARGGV